MPEEQEAEPTTAEHLLELALDEATEEIVIAAPPTPVAASSLEVLAARG